MPKIDWRERHCPDCYEDGTPDSMVVITPSGLCFCWMCGYEHQIALVSWCLSCGKYPIWDKEWQCCIDCAVDNLFTYEKRGKRK